MIAWPIATWKRNNQSERKYEIQVEFSIMLKVEWMAHQFIPVTVFLSGKLVSGLI